MQLPGINSPVSALRFFFTVTLDRPDVARRLAMPRQSRRLRDADVATRRRAAKTRAELYDVLALSAPGAALGG